MNGSKRNGFTLIEMIAILAVIAILVMLAVGPMNRAIKNARATKCLSNLRACGSAMLVYAVENDGFLPLAFGGNATNLESKPELASTPQYGLTWMRYLQREGYLSDYSVAACPSVSPYRYSYVAGQTQHAYGMRRTTSTAFTPVRLSLVERPSSFVLLADSINWPGGSIPESFTFQWYFIDHPGAGRNRMHTRHNGRAHIFFLDGSQRALTRNEILDLGDGWSSNSIDDTGYSQ